MCKNKWTSNGIIQCISIMLFCHDKKEDLINISNKLKIRPFLFETVVDSCTSAFHYIFFCSENKEMLNDLNQLLQSLSGKRKNCKCLNKKSYHT